MTGMLRLPTLAVLTMLLVATGCFHQVVRTGAPPGAVVIERPWTATYLFGLVPANAINTAAQCPNGVAIVATQQTFMNGLVGVLTIGIYTPQTVTITCAAAPLARQEGRSMSLPADASIADREAAVREAIELARRTGELVIVIAAAAGNAAD
jgi:hypothetical protein